jgi:hypothetical protein
VNRLRRFLPLFVAISLGAQTAPQAADSWQALSFLQGTWQAKTGEGSTAKVTGTYTFATELKGHVLARHSTVAGCTGPEAFDCQHGDLLYIFDERPGQPLKAIYFDNEGHVIHYGLSTPDATTAIFLSEPGPGPRFRLVYHLEHAVMYGKFQMQMPGQEDWKSYLEWSGSKQ